MTESPEKTQKQKKEIEKRNKIKAFQSFLTKNQTSTGLQLIKNAVPQEQQHTSQTKQRSSGRKSVSVDQENIQCSVCSIQLDDRRKQCGFCHQPACVEHLRKKRKSKETNKFVKICDKCEDQFLFSKYMKFELKNEESIAAQEIIVQTKHSQLDMQCRGRKTKILLLYHKQNQILAQKKEHQSKSAQIQNQIRQKFQRLEKRQREVKAMQQQLERLQAELPPSYQQDFQALQLESNKINSDLVKFEKLCNEALKTKSRRERQIYEEYHEWERTERQKMGNKGSNGKKDDCSIC